MQVEAERPLPELVERGPWQGSVGGHRLTLGGRTGHQALTARED